MGQMEHIAKALRKASAEGKSVKEQHRVVPRRRHGTPKAREVVRVIYDETRTVDVSPDVLEHRRVIAGFSRNVQADKYRILRSQVLQRLTEIDGTSVGVVSPNPGDGKTLTSVNLAVSMAMVPTHSVLLVDLDLRKPRLHEYFGLDCEPGISDYLLGKATIPDCLVHPGIDRLVILPAGRGLRYSSEALGSPRMLSLIGELKKRYTDRLIVFDLPPLLSTDDAIVLLPHIDASLLVVQEGKTRSGEVQRCLDVLQAHRFMGTVLNNSVEIDPYPYY